ncbi:MAG: VTT domain-containing protein [Candidatus Heimdallarchaeota archaeon]
MDSPNIVKNPKGFNFLKKYGGIIFIGAILVLFIILALLNINFGQWLANTVFIFYDEFGDFGIYLAIFLISIFGNFTIIFPVPYVVALVVVSAVIPVNPILIGIVAGLGASLGEVTAWLIGRSSKEMIGDSKSMERMKRYVDKGWAPLLIFIFAATPLPDDAFLIVLGLAQYSIVKTLIYCFIGKFILCFLCSALPIWLADTSLGIFLFGLFGIDIDAARNRIIPPSTPLEILQSSLVWAASIILLFLLVYIDWNKVFQKIKAKLKSNKEI